MWLYVNADPTIKPLVPYQSKSYEELLKVKLLDVAMLVNVKLLGWPELLTVRNIQYVIYYNIT